jgi:hypothetical protein
MKSEPPFFRRPRVQILLGIFLTLALYFYATLRAGGWLVNLLVILRDGLLCGLFLVAWFIFFAQFILPVEKLSDRIKLLERIVLSYVPEIPALGLKNIHGPAIFIKDGKIIQKVTKTEGEVKEEIQKKGPGVIWLDSASAAVLRTAVKFTRAVGPGIVFTRRFETIAGVVDLHTQKQSIGPAEGEDPFAPKPEGMSEDKFKELQERSRWSSSGMTRDGIEVVANISVVFKIDAEEEKQEGGTNFGFNADAIFKAVANEGINPSAKQDSPHFHVPWNEIPAFIAVDVWREYLRKFTLSQLFEALPNPPADGREERTALQFIGDCLNERLRNANVTLLDDFGRPGGQKIPSREYRLIKDNGIKIVKVNIKKVYFAPSIEEQLIRQWTANWLETARREREQVEQKRSLASHAGVEDALKEFALLASQEITKNPPEHPREGLENLLQDTLKGIIRNPSLYRRLSTEPQDITEMIQWLRENA